MDKERELTEEELELVQAGFPNEAAKKDYFDKISSTMSVDELKRLREKPDANHDSDELTEEQLERVSAGHTLEDFVYLADKNNDYEDIFDAKNVEKLREYKAYLKEHYLKEYAESEEQKQTHK